MVVRVTEILFRRRCMKEFFGYGGYTRQPEGYMSWQHLTFVTSLMLIMIVLAIYLGRKYRFSDDKTKNKTVIASAILIDTIEIIKIIVCITRSDTPETAWHGLLPLFLCSIQLITIPLAAFAKGRVKEAALDFVFIFGILGAVLGTYGAGQNYGAYPVLSVDNVFSGITHAVSGFASLYIVISGMASMKKKNTPITFAILFAFGIAALATNLALDTNYMFLVRGDGTPYDILYNMVGGNAIIYPILVMALFVVYILVFQYVFNYFANKKISKITADKSPENEYILK